VESIVIDHCSYSPTSFESSGSFGELGSVSVVEDSMQLLFCSRY